MQDDVYYMKQAIMEAEKAKKTVKSLLEQS